MACYTIKEGKDLWDYAKAKYLSIPHPTKGYMDFKELTNKLSDDIWTATGGTFDNSGKRVTRLPNGYPAPGRQIVPEEVAKLLATPKSVRSAGKNLLMANKNRQGALAQARAFTTQTERTPLGKFLSTAYQLPYAAKTIGHGPALHMTHAWAYALDPMKWGIFGRSWVNAWRAMKPSNARAFAEDIMLDPRFDEKVHSGLAVDPRATYDDVQNRAQFLGAFGHMTRNSFIGLKQLRSWTWDQMYDAVPEHLKTQEMRDLISRNVNHMTGAPGEEGRMLSGKGGDIARGVMFAPSLDIARVMRMYDLGESMTKGGRTLANHLPVMGEHLKKFWGESSPEEQFVARQNMKQWVRIGAVFTGLLYANQQLLTHAFGSKEKVNIGDPFKGDWMTGKGPNGRVFQFTGGQVPMIRAGTRMILKPKTAGTALGDYLMGKINPALSLAKDLITGTRFGGQTTPTSQSSPLDWTAYLAAEVGPIATEDGINEFAKQMSDQNGIPQEENSKFLKAARDAALVTVPAVLGTHSYQPEPKKSSGKAVFSSPFSIKGKKNSPFPTK